MNYGSIIDMFFPRFFFPASYFMSYHKILKTSPEYTAALKSAREIAKNISKTIGVEVFPYRWEIHQVERAQFKYHKFDETPS